MKYYIIAGEVSGDLHGAALIESIYKKDPDAEIRFWGGDQMAKLAGNPVKHIRDLAFMGFVAVAKNLRTILQNIKLCKQDIQEFQPDVVVLIDYPGFNLRIAEFAKKNAFKVAYYIAPQVWAWKASRVKKIKAFVDELMVILPFEKDFFKSHGVDSTFVGHPLSDRIQQYKVSTNFKKDNQLLDQPIVALLPGSRIQEIERLLPKMTSIVGSFSDYQFVIAGVSPHEASLYESTGLPFVMDQTYDLLANADFAVVTSGTATLETAFFNVPQVVVYQGTRLLYEVGKRLVKVPYISLVNLIAEQLVVEELIQDQVQTENIVVALQNAIEQSDQIKVNYRQMVDKIQSKNASENAASCIFELANAK